MFLFYHLRISHMPVMYLYQTPPLPPSSFFPITDFWLLLLPTPHIPLLKHLVSLFSSAPCTRFCMCILNVYVGHGVRVFYLRGCLCAAEVSGVLRDQRPWEWSHNPCELLCGCSVSNLGPLGERETPLNAPSTLYMILQNIFL